jgi:hypothetical protein
VETESTSTDVAVIHPVTAQTILADLIDECKRCNIKLPQQIIGQYAKRFKDHLEEGYTRDQIWAALVIMAQEKVLGKPSYLPNKLVTVQTGPEQYPQRQKRSATDEAVEGWLALAEHFPEEVAA